jgi:VanZ family protein
MDLVRRRHACLYNMKHFLKYWLPLLIWLGVIFFGSTDMMSAEHTSRFIVPILRWLKPEISLETLALIQFVVRKCAHLTEYAILALLLFRAVISAANRKSMWHLSVSVWITCVFVAAMDEFHQSFVASRTAAPHDVLIDICGALIGIVLCLMFSRRRLTRNR